MRRSIEIGILLLLLTVVVGYTIAPEWLFPHMLPSERIAVVLFVAVVSGLTSQQPGCCSKASPPA